MTHDAPFSRALTPGQLADQYVAFVGEQRAFVERALEQGLDGFASLVAPMEEQDARMHAVSGIVQHLSRVQDTPDTRAADDLVRQVGTEHGLWLVGSAALYEALKRCQNLGGLDLWQAAVVREVVKAFEDRGVGLAPEKAARLDTITRQLSDLSTAFKRNVQDTVDGWHLVLEPHQVLGAPDTLVDMLRHAGEGTITGLAANLQGPVFVACMKDLPDRRAREALWRAYNARCTADGGWGRQKQHGRDCARAGLTPGAGEHGRARDFFGVGAAQRNGGAPGQRGTLAA